MSVMNKDKLYRIVDANINRACEGLRVCEEIVRFVYDDAEDTSCIKKIRHAIKTSFPEDFDYFSIKLSRDTDGDVGTYTYEAGESVRTDMRQVFCINMQRVQEALRVLEEFVKLIEPSMGSVFKNIRYEVYQAEKNILVRLSK